MSTQNQSLQPEEQRLVSLQRLARRLHTSNTIAITFLIILTILVMIIFLAVVVQILFQGIPYIINPDFYAASGTGAVGAQIFNTVYILVLTEIFLIPIALSAAIFMVEYAPRGRIFTFIHFASDTLAGVPSIVLGLFGVLIFCDFFGFHFSRIAGALTLLCLNFPLALRLFEDALTSVPREMREGGLALGTTKWHTIRTVVLPSALPGIITGIVLSAGKIIGESAALIFTMGASNPLNVYTLDPRIASDTLTLHIWYFQTGGGGVAESVGNAVSAGSAALLVILLLVINFGARFIGNWIQHKLTAA
jgi:phosphate transport system permease protein